MTQITKWKYYMGHCWFKPTKKGGIFGGRIDEGFWAIQLDKEFSLQDGLNYMGDLGYELVAVQQSWAVHGGEVSSGYCPSYLYIFKKPVEQQNDNRKTEDPNT